MPGDDSESRYYYMDCIKILAPLVLTVCVLSVEAAEFKADFENGMPEGTELFDFDRNAPSPDLDFMGFSIDVPWVVYGSGDSSGKAACSTSWYTPAGTSDDWMVLPAVAVESGVVLQWSAKAGDENLPDGYSVYVYEGEDVDKDGLHRAERVFFTDAERVTWRRHSISLEAYAGKTVRVAFVNDSEDCSTLWIDDIFIGVPLNVDFRLDFQPQVVPGTEVPLKITVFNTLDSEVKGYEAAVSVAGERKTVSDPEYVFAPGGSVDVDFGITVTPGRDETIPVDITVGSGGVGKSQRYVVSGFLKRLTVEERTGTWCMFCPQGFVVFDEMEELYGDRFVPIAIHGGEDPMVITHMDYGFSASGYPQIWVNREEGMKKIPVDLREYAAEVVAEPADGAVRIELEEFNGREVKVAVTTYSAKDMDDHKWRLGFVITENDVHVADDFRYNQVNAYADSENGPMGGWENKPAVVLAKDMWYQDVARGGLEPNDGIEDSLPAVMTAGIPVTSHYTLEIPDNVLIADNCEVTVLLMRGPYGASLVNSDRVSLKDSSSVRNVIMSDGPSVKAVSRGGYLCLTADSQIVSVRLYGTDGCLVHASEPESASFETQVNTDGIVIYSVVTESGVFTGKFRF